VERHLLARLARAQAESRAPSIVAGLVRGGELRWSAGRGEVAGAEPDSSTQYRIGSITKTFAAVLVMKLRDTGRLDLGDPVETHLPGAGLGPATVAQLLSHTTGLRSETASPWWERTAGSGYDQLAATSLQQVGEAGRAFHYSNTGFALLGELTSRLYGEPWTEALQREILDPLGMNRTTTRPRQPAAQGFAVHPWADVLLPEPEHDHGAMAPAGQLWSTIEDLGRFTAALAGDGDLLSAATLEEMAAPQALIDQRDVAWQVAYGLGLQLWNDGGRRTHGHGGSMPGFLAFVETSLGGDGVIVLSNSTAGLDIRLLAADLLSILDRHEPHLPGPWHPTPTSAQTLALLGVWYWGPTPVGLHAAGEDLEIRGVGRGGRPSRFVPDGPDRWHGLDEYYRGEPLRVVRRGDGTPLHLEVSGSFVLTREPYEPGVGVPGGDASWEV
jgi:CubicO group peptidase (beta-lactamase class C family)